MTTEKIYAFLGKPLSMKEYLTGYDPRVYDPTRGTQFKWTQSLLSKSHGQMTLIKRQLHEWLEMINEKSGVIVTGYKIKGDYNEFSRTRFKFWEITFDFAMKGTFNTIYLHPSLAREFPGQTKKFMAEELLRRFPLPFTSDEVLFAADVVDMYILKPSRDIKGEFAKMQEIILSEEFRIKFAELLANKFAADLFLVKYMGERARYWKETAIFIKWRNDTTKHQQYELEKELRQLLIDLGARYRSGGYNYDFYKILHES